MFYRCLLMIVLKYDYAYFEKCSFTKINGNILFAPYHRNGGKFWIITSDDSLGYTAYNVYDDYFFWAASFHFAPV